MKEKFDVIALGELLMDFTMNGVSEQGNALFEANPGGAPCNVLAMLNKLGKTTAFIGKVGGEQFGKILKETLTEIKIDTSNLYMDKEVNTTLAFVHTFPDGDREFSFYRKPGADMMLNEDEIDEKFLCKTKIFHFGTLSMTDEGVRKATKKALQIAKDNKKIISFDPNLRPALWSSLELAKEQMEYGFGYCDILKISDNEIQFVTGKENYDDGISYLREHYDIPLIVLTMGKNGARAYYKDARVEMPGFLQEKTVDTTGAGDTFCGCVLNYILEYGLDSLTEDQLAEMLKFANGAASLITTKKGAIRSMPEKTEVLSLIKEKEIKKANNIILIGFMGVGKSTISEYLSTTLGMNTMEMDQIIVEREKMSIPDIFSTYGEEYFRNLETNLLIEMQSRTKLIISCGGGVALREKNVVEMRRNGHIILLTASPETILERVKDSDERPLLKGNKNVEFIKDLIEKRREKYVAAADIIIQTDHKTVSEIGEEIIQKLEELDG